MADDVSASVIPLHQPRPKKVKTGAERAKAYRRRKKASAADVAPPSSEHLIPLDFPSADAANAALPIPAPAEQLSQIRQLPSAPPPTVTLRGVRPSRRPVASVLLSTAALALAAVGIVMNGWFARSLGSTDSAGWLFMCRPALPDFGTPASGAGTLHDVAELRETRADARHAVISRALVSLTMCTGGGLPTSIHEP
jgi:hypothetical protein